MMKYMVSVLLFFVSFMSFGADFVVGKDYEIITNSDSAKPIGKNVEVAEFFSFGCPWCYRLEPSLTHWLNLHKSGITFKKVPVVFNKDWEYYAKAYYLTEALKRPDLRADLFKAILDEKKSLKSNKAMTEFFIQKGADPAIVKSAFDFSTEIDMSVKKGEELMAHYHIVAVPAFVVNHQFKTDLQMAKTEERLFAILDFLISQSTVKKVAHG
jgi:thiol:disulfide interchange protein DsbA